MGVFGALGKMAGSKVIEKVEDELTKKQNRDQTSGYCNYINNNIVHICDLITNLEAETRTLIDSIVTLSDSKLSFKEKSEFRKMKEKARTSLAYMYLAKDFFIALAKNASGLILKNEEFMLVVKFAPYFDGVPVLDIDTEENSDDSLLGEFKEIGQELKETFISSKKDPKHFYFDEYIMCRYEENIDNYIIPDVNAAVERFKAAMEAQEPTATETAVPVMTATEVSAEQIVCSNCGAMLNANSKFCPECGNKIKIKKPSFCTECGEPVTDGAKFCAGCGTKLM